MAKVEVSVSAVDFNRVHEHADDGAAEDNDQEAQAGAQAAEPMGTVANGALHASALLLDEGAQVDVGVESEFWRDDESKGPREEGEGWQRRRGRGRGVGRRGRRVREMMVMVVMVLRLDVDVTGSGGGYGGGKGTSSSHVPSVSHTGSRLSRCCWRRRNR